MLPGGGAEPPTRDDLRRLEARLDARLQEVNARVVLHDGRFAAMGDRINQTDRRCDALSARIDSRLRSMDRRFDTVETRLDTTDIHLQDTRDRVLDEVKSARRQQAKMTMLGLAGSTATTATLCFGTLVVLI
jgi:hypothetical protein